MQQRKLKRGVWPQTISELSTLGKALLEDNCKDGRPNQIAVEAFIAYLKTLPSSEQKAIDDLKMPATDSHRGVPFDTSIGEAVVLTGVKGNRICSHKVGDFLTKAGRYLKRSKEDKPEMFSPLVDFWRFSFWGILAAELSVNGRKLQSIILLLVSCTFKFDRASRCPSLHIESKVR